MEPSVNDDDREMVQASVRAFARFAQWQMSGDPEDERRYQEEVDTVAALLGDDAPAPERDAQEG